MAARALRDPDRNRIAQRVFLGYLAAAVLMLAAAAVEAVIGIDAERASLEKVAEPLSVHYHS